MLAFLGISGFAAIVGATGVFAFLAIGNVLERITKERIPSALTAQEVSRQAGRVISAAPVLLTVSDEEELGTHSRAIEGEAERLDLLVQNLGKMDFPSSKLSLIWEINRDLRINLSTLYTQMRDRLVKAAKRKRTVERAQSTYDQIRQLLEPWVLVTDAKIALWRDAVDREAVSAAKRAQAEEDLKDSLPWLHALRELQLLMTSMSESLQRLAASEDRQRLKLSGLRLTVLMRKAAEWTAQLDPKLRPQMSDLLTAYRDMVAGPDSIVSIRKAELELVAGAVDTLEQNAKLSRRLTAAVNDLVSEAQSDIAAANAEAEQVQTASVTVTAAVVVLSLACSVLIVWLYVGRNLVARLTALSNSMLAISGGNLRAPLPAVRGEDEISQMAKALTVFRDTALEVEEKNLREVEETRRRLVDALESTTEGFAFYDSSDRLQLCNSRYEQMLYPGSARKLKEGTSFEEIIGDAARSGLIPNAVGRVDEWVAERLEMHRNPAEPHLHQLRAGRWILVSERKTGAGGTVAVYSDITELKLREEELAQKSTALEEKSNALELLSNQLAKYLSPQVYNSIFSGAQEVKVASSRKKLTVFFSDIVGFTEATDRLESEDLTHLINNYLTEMAKIALEHGATVDKYIGDAIMIFFGDPESKGVKADALACVEMAIAMRKRLTGVQTVWHDAGIEKPLQVRMGIHTGYCTVGNFGSEDRMDYTIIGGAVNTASRLESVAPAGEILISYETFSQIKDRIACEERGEVEVKGIAYPIATYQVVDLYENLDRNRREFHQEHTGLKVDLDIDQMTDDDRNRALVTLQRALDALAREGNVPRQRREGTEPNP